MRTTRRITVFLLIVLSLSLPAGATAGQQGGHILYEDRAAAGQQLEFRAFVWHVRGDYYRAVGDYRQVGSKVWKGLDRNWCWTRRCALKEIITQARFIARDGYIWRFQEPGSAPGRAARYRFDESDYRDGTGRCATRLVRGSR